LNSAGNEREFNVHQRKVYLKKGRVSSKRGRKQTFFSLPEVARKLRKKGGNLWPLFPGKTSKGKGTLEERTLNFLPRGSFSKDQKRGRKKLNRSKKKRRVSPERKERAFWRGDIVVLHGKKFLKKRREENELTLFDGENTSWSS